jgi:DNA-directed RNA polymerase subunit K/omega
MSLVRPITRRDIKGPALYGPIRDDYRQRVIAIKRARRIVIGDRVSLVFENRHTLTVQIEEICRAEHLTRDDQIEAEIAVYNELMPTETSLSATLFIELPPEEDPYVALKRLVGLDEHVVLHIGPHAIRATFEPGRSTDDRISAVQYTRYPLTSEARAALLTPGTAVAVEIDHPNYRHRIACPEATRASLAADYA